MKLKEMNPASMKTRRNLIHGQQGMTGRSFVYRINVGVNGGKKS